MRHDVNPMPSFKFHQITNYFILILLVLVFSYFYVFDWRFLLFGIGYFIGTEYITPDLDTNSIPYNKAKPVWWLYKELFKHRKTSHNLFIGVISRLSYLIILYALAMYTLRWIFGLPVFPAGLQAEFMQFAREFAVQIILFIGGIAVANAMHIVLDITYSKVKRWTK